MWSEDRGRWAKSYVYAGHELSINSISWAPHEFGQVLVCGSSDGHVSVLTQKGTLSLSFPLRCSCVFNSTQRQMIGLYPSLRRTLVA